MPKDFFGNEISGSPSDPLKVGVADDPNDQPNPANPGGISNNELARRQAALRTSNSGYQTPAAAPPVDTRTAEQKAQAAYQHGNTGGAGGAYNAGGADTRAGYDAMHPKQTSALSTLGRVATAAINPLGTAAALGVGALGGGKVAQTLANVATGPTAAATVGAQGVAQAINGGFNPPAKAPTGASGSGGAGAGGMPTSPAAAGIAPPVTPDPLAGGGAPAAPSAWDPQSADYSRYDQAAQDLSNARNTFQSELTRLSGADPFGNQAFMQKATDRAVAQAAGTAAGARGGAAAQAGALRQQQGVQSQLAARGVQDMTQLKAQDANTASQLRLGAAAGIADVSKAAAENEVSLADQAIKQADVNLRGYLGGRELDSRERESLRGVALELGKIDQQRYQTDVAYRENVNDNLAKLYAADSALKGLKMQVDAQENMSPSEFFMGLLGMGSGLAQGAVMKSDRRSKFNIHDPDLRDLQDYLGNSRGKLYNYKSPKSPGQRSGLNFGPMAQDLQKSKIGRTVVVEGKDGLYVDTGRLALADHAALAALAADVAALKRGGKK